MARDIKIRAYFLIASWCIITNNIFIWKKWLSTHSHISWVSWITWAKDLSAATTHCLWDSGFCEKWLMGRWCHLAWPFLLAGNLSFLSIYLWERYFLELVCILLLFSFSKFAYLKFRYIPNYKWYLRNLEMWYLGQRPTSSVWSTMKTRGENYKKV